MNHDETNPIHQFEGQWYFYDETWSSRLGPFDSEDEARKQLNIYADNL